MRHRPYLVLFVALLLALLPACKKQEQPADSGTLGNATDRNPASGTNGTGEPASVGTDTAHAATQLGTAGTTTATAPPGAQPAVVGTEDVHAATTVTTSTISQPGVSSTQAVETPTATSATIATQTGATTATAGKKKKH